MKRGVTHSKKIELLMAILNIPRYQAVGILEMLWHVTDQKRFHGDIGTMSNREIAKQLGWAGDPDALIEALVESRWLDESGPHRLLIHDWPEHCDAAVHMKIARRKEWFADGTQPKLLLPKKELAEARAFYKKHKPPPIVVITPTLPGMKLDGTPKKKRQGRPVEKNPFAEQFCEAYMEVHGVEYAPVVNEETGKRDWPSTGDFVQLVRFHKARPKVTPEEFVAVAKACWSRGEFANSTSKTIRGLCAYWASHVATAKALATRPREPGGIPQSSTGRDQTRSKGKKVTL